MTEGREDRERGEDTEAERFQERERENGEGKVQREAPSGGSGCCLSPMGRLY